MSPLRHLAALALGAVLLGGCDTASPIDPPAPSPWLPGVQMAPADASGLSDSLRAVFREDAQRLALRRVHGLVDFGLTEEEEPVEIPEEVAQFFFDGLVHVYNATGLPARDSVFGIIPPFQVHTFPSPYLEEISLRVDPEAEWVAAWVEGEWLTGHPTIDSLVLHYDLSVEYRFGTSSSHRVTLSAPEPLNTRALAARFLPVPGVQGAFTPTWIPTETNDPDIVGKALPTGAEFLFRLGWGDCPAGCISSHRWEFAVALDGVVQYLGSSGDEVPDYFYP